MATRQITVSPDGGVNNIEVIFTDDSSTVPTDKGPKLVSALAVGDRTCVRIGTDYIEIVSIP